MASSPPPPHGWVAKDPKAFGCRDELTIDAWQIPKAIPESGGRSVDRAIAGTLDGFLLDSHPVSPTFETGKAF